VHDLGWLAAAIGVGLAVAIAVRFLLFFPDQKKALQRTERSFAARAQKVAGTVLDVFDDAGRDPRPARRLQTQLLRFNEAALMFDAQLGDPAAVDGGSSRQQLHQCLFDFELALDNVARFAEALARVQLPEAERNEIRLALLDVVERNPDGARRHAESLGALDGHDDASRTASGPDGTRPGRHPGRPAAPVRRIDGGHGRRRPGVAVGGHARTGGRRVQARGRPVRGLAARIGRGQRDGLGADDPVDEHREPGRDGHRTGQVEGLARAPAGVRPG